MANIFENYKLYKQHHQLLKRAEEIFPTTVLYNNFKDQLDLALNQGDLTQAEFALDTFELMQQNENSPLFYDTLNQRLTDPLFCEFSDLIMNITPQYAQTEFVATSEINNQLLTDHDGEQTIVSAKEQELNTNIKLPASNKKVLNIVNGIITNSEVMYTPDGIVTDKNAYTTSTLEQAREEAFKNDMEKATSEQDVINVVESFTPNDDITPTTIDSAPKSFEDNSEFSQIDNSTISEESKTIVNAIIEERRRSQTSPEDIAPNSAALNSQASEMGLE